MISNSQPNVKKNYFLRLAYEVLTVITPFITTPYISRVLEADGVGTYSFATSIVAYFVMLSTLGTWSYGSREIARNRNSKAVYSQIFWEIEIMTVFTTIACILGWICVIIFSKEYRPYFIALTPMIAAAAFEVSWFYAGLENIIYTVSVNAMFKLLGLISLFCFVRRKEDLVLYALINSLVLCLGNLSMWIFLPKFLVKVDFSKLNFKTHFKETLVYFIPTIATSIYTVLDKTLINAITGDVFENGYYEQATKIVNIIKTFVFVSVNAVMGVRISYLFAEERFEEIHIKIRKSMDFILLLGYGCVFGLVGVAKSFVPLFLGEGYDEVIPLLYCMSGLILIIGISNCLGSLYYNPSGKRKQSAKYIIIGSFSNLCANLFLIPFAGAIGATVASIIAECFITILYLKNCNGFLTVKILWECSWKRIVAGILMVAVVIGIGESSISSNLMKVIFQIICGVVIYFSILLLLKDEMLSDILKEGFSFLKLGSKKNGQA